MDMDAIATVIEEALASSGLSAREASARAGSPYLIRDIRRGHVPSVNRLNRLCRVLDLNLSVSPRQPARSSKTPLELKIAGGSAARNPVRDRALAELLAAVVEHWDELNEYGRRDFAANVWRTSPLLGARRSGGSSRGSDGG